MQQENNSQNTQTRGDTDYPDTQPQHAASMDDSQQGTRRHQNTDASTEGRFEIGGDPNQMGTHGHPQDESLRNGLNSGRGGGLGDGLSDSSKGRDEGI